MPPRSEWQDAPVGGGPRCAECRYELDAAHDEPERRECPRCGSLARAHEASLHATAETQVSVSGTVERGLNELRLAVLAMLVTIGLTVGFGVPGPWWAGVAAGVGSFALACALIAWGRSRHYLMALMHRLTRG